MEIKSLEVLNYIPEGAFVIDSNYSVIFWNRTLEQWTTIQHKDIIGKNMMDYFPHLTKPRYALRLQNVLENGPPAIFSSQLHGYIIPSRLADNNYQIQHTTVTSILTDDGKRCALFFIKDVTDLTQKSQHYRSMRDHALEEISIRKRIEDQLRESNLYLAQAQKIAHIGHWHVELDTEQTVWSEEMFRILEISPRDLPKMEMLFKNIHPDDKQVIEEKGWQKIGQSPLDVIEYRVLLSDNRIRTLHGEGYLIYDDNANVQKAIGTLQDITQRKLAEQQTLDLALERERTNLLANFIQDISHEFRTPLSIINTKTHLLRRIYDDEKASIHLESIEDRVNEINKMVSTLGLMVRLDSKNPLAMKEIILNDIIIGIFSSYQEKFRKKNIYTILNLKKNPIHINGDAIDLQTAFSNIIHNAINATYNGTITCTTAIHNKMIHIEISDTGRGIDKADLPHVFERLYRADKSRSTHGLGLGLPIALKIIQQHGGTMRIESTINIGSTVFITLPLLEQSHTE